MFKNLHNRFFPIPKFLLAASFGLNISDQSLKFTKIIPTKKGMKLEKYGERDIEPGIVESGKIKDMKKMEDILVSLRREEKINSARVSLPEELIYIYKLKLEKADIENIRQTVEFSLEEHVPLQAENAIFDYEILNEDVQSIEVQVAVIQKDIIENYISVFKKSGISVLAFELEAQALARVVIEKGDLDTYMVVDFGEKNTGISIISGGVVEFASTVDVGGITLTSMIQKSLGITFAEAEKIKTMYGLQRNIQNKEVFPILLNTVSILRDEIGKLFLYWNTHKDEDGKDRPLIKKIIFCGGSSNLIGLPEYFSVSMKNPIEMADVWVNFSKEKNIRDLSFRQSLSYATALGLALGHFNYD
jgi:type IV pilus assembly protein PilM